MERDGGGGKEEKINQGEPEPEVMSRRTCANRSGSLAGCVAESIRIFCHTTWIRRHRTLTPYLLYSLSSLFLYILFPPLIFSSLLRRHSPALRFLLTLPLPSTHALILNPLDNLRPVLCPVLDPLPIPTTSLHLSPLPSQPNPRLPHMSTKGRSTPRVVCCAIPIARAAGKVLVITSRKRPNYWVCESLPPARSTSAFSLIQPCFLKCRKAVGSPQMLRSRLLPRERPGKKVESFVPLPVPPHPDIHFAPCSHCCGFLL
jgi:hypothetical protein